MAQIDSEVLASLEREVKALDGVSDVQVKQVRSDLVYVIARIKPEANDAISDITSRYQDEYGILVDIRAIPSWT